MVGTPLFYRGIEYPKKAKKGWDLNFAVGWGGILR